MATYCVSDIHGYYKQFMSVLESIPFTDSDTLYIIGDIIDRGPDTRRLLKWAINAPDNIHVIKGNHEDMLASYLKSIHSENLSIRRSAHMEHPWLWNSHQQKDIIHIYDTHNEKFWNDTVLPWIESLPLYENIIVNNRRFVLVHAGFNPRQWDSNARWYRQGALRWEGADNRVLTIKDLGEQYTQDMLWSRDGWYDRNECDPVHIVCGHTPNSPYHTRMLKQSASYTNIPADIHPFRVCHVGTRHLIDCASGYRNRNRHGDIAILRLDDLAAFYGKATSPVYPNDSYLTWFQETPSIS